MSRCRIRSPPLRAGADHRRQRDDAARGGEGSEQDSPGQTSSQSPTSGRRRDGDELHPSDAPKGAFRLRHGARCSGALLSFLAPQRSLGTVAARGGLPERPKGAVCKTAGIAYVGSNPSPATMINKSLTWAYAQVRGSWGYARALRFREPWPRAPSRFDDQRQGADLHNRPPPSRPEPGWPRADPPTTGYSRETRPTSPIPSPGMPDHYVGPYRDGVGQGASDETPVDGMYSPFGYVRTSRSGTPRNSRSGATSPLRAPPRDNRAGRRGVRAERG